MKKLIFCLMSCASILMFCLTAQSADQTKWSQPVDTTNPAGQVSRVVVTPTPYNDLGADDWVCMDGAPITKIKWWGDYHHYDVDNPGPVSAPTAPPLAFILRQYSNDATDPLNTRPGTIINEVEIPIANVTQAYVQSVPVTAGPPASYLHIFSYEATLPTPWTQTQGTIYWLSIQAKYDQDPAFLDPQPYVNWEWLNTPPTDFLGTGQVSYDGGTTWAKAEYFGGPYVGQKFNFAFQLLPTTFSPFNLKLGSAVLPTSGTIVLSADITVQGTPYAGVSCLPYVAITAGGTQFFILSGNKITTTMTPYLTAGKGKNRYFKLYDNITDLTLASIPYVGLEKGQYPVVGALLNDKGALMGQLAERTLTIE